MNLLTLYHPKKEIKYMNSKLYPLFGTRLKSTACGILLVAAAIGASA